MHRTSTAIGSTQSPHERPEQGRPGNGLTAAPGQSLPLEQRTGDEITPFDATGGHLPVDPGVPPLPNEPTLLTIGAITITQTSVITPAGGFPIKDSLWTISDTSHTEQSAPT